jgi:hypothetical protein
MRIVFLSIALLFALQPHSLAAGLNCQKDPNNKNDPYKRFKDGNISRMQNDALPLKAAGVVNQIRADMLAGLMKDYEKLCVLRELLEASASGLRLISNKQDLAQNKGALENINPTTQNMSKLSTDHVKGIEDALKRQQANYDKFSKDDRNAVSPEAFGKVGVKNSFRMAWGAAPGEALTEAGRKKGQFSNLILQIKEERDLAKARQPEFDQLAQQVEESRQKIASLNAIDPMKASAQRNGDEWGKLQLKPGDPGYVDPNATQQPLVDPARDPANPNPAPVLEGPVKQENEEGWISRNKGTLLLGAGAAAVVGGVLWYKHDQDKKKDEKNDWINNQVNSATATATATSTSSSTSTGTGTAAKTLSVAGFPASASTNYVLPAITATVSGSDSDGIDITIACVSSCSLAGTLTKKTAGGKAEFTDLYFTAPHEGVQLRVSGTGLNSIASPGSFNVIQGGRQ